MSRLAVSSFLKKARIPGGPVRLISIETDFRLIAEPYSIGIQLTRMNISAITFMVVNKAIIAY